MNFIRSLKSSACLLARSLPDGLTAWLAGLTAGKESKPSVKDADERQSSDRTIERSKHAPPKRGKQTTRSLTHAWLKIQLQLQAGSSLSFSLSPSLGLARLDSIRAVAQPFGSRFLERARK
ncbi:hypothetical protein AWZ03_012674 [Drosophila navojoa]|uniref:Uncharacterized protein n=1 Tax=Drosophila navojoa TaxID=7232 RepID=A0A484AZ96_DRONA|nr:hypothetical protein AWZ03_012674 [Drosophila navojoa]